MKQKTRTLTQGAAWALAGRWIERALSLVSITILARMLTREQFGLVATAGLVVGAVEVFFAFGFDWALVRIPKATSEHYSTAWTLRIIVSVICASIMLLVSRPMSVYFNSPEVIGIVAVMAVTTLLGSLENPAIVEFRRNMDFRPELVIRLVIKVTALLVATILAWTFHTFWALPVSLFASRVVGVFASYRMHSFRPRWRLSERRELLGFSSWLLINNLIDYAKSRSSDIFVARGLGNGALGIMSLSQELSQVAVSEIAAPINRAVFSKYSSDRDDIERLKAGYLGASSLIWLTCLPIAFLLLTNAGLAVKVLYGDQWLEAEPILRILLVGNVFMVLSSNASYVYLANGETKFLASISVLGIFVTLASLFILVPVFGLQGAAAAYVLGMTAPLPILMLKLFKRLSISPREFFFNNYRSMTGAACILATSTLLGSKIHSTWISAAIELAFNCCVLGLTYIFAVFSLWSLAGRPEGPESLIYSIAIGAKQRILVWRRE